LPCLHGNPCAKVYKINRRIVCVLAGVQVPEAAEAKNLAHQAAADEVFSDLVVVR
jgi:hypothetical protein